MGDAFHYCYNGHGCCFPLFPSIMLLDCILLTAITTYHHFTPIIWLQLDSFLCHPSLSVIPGPVWFIFLLLYCFFFFPFSHSLALFFLPSQVKNNPLLTLKLLFFAADVYRPYQVSLWFFLSSYTFCFSVFISTGVACLLWSSLSPSISIHSQRASV